MPRNQKRTPPPTYREDAELFVDTKRLLREAQELLAKSEFDTKCARINRKLSEDLAEHFKANSLNGTSIKTPNNLVSNQAADLIC